MGEDALDELAEAGRTGEIGAVAGQVDSGQHDFVLARRDGALDRVDHRACWGRAARPAPERDRLMGPVRLIRLPESQIHQQTEQPAIPYADKPWLLLTAEQLDQLNTAKRKCFARQLIEYGQCHFPKSLGSLASTALQQWAMDCQASAARSGFSAVDEVFLWVRFCVVLGADFPDGPEHAAYRQLLAEPGLLPRQRLDNLNRALTHQLLNDKDFTR